MFDTLLASGPVPNALAGPRLLAAGIHIAVITGAVLGTTRVVADAPHVAPHIDIWVPGPPARSPEAPVPAEDIPGAPDLPSVPGVEWSAMALPAPLPSEATASLPRLPALMKRLDGAAGAPVTEPGLSPVRLAAEVDQPVAVLEPGILRYPPRLQALGISGRVIVEFVVDTTGAVEGASLRVRVSTQPEFEEAARAAILATRFRPAQVRGRPVRQLASQAVVFRVQ